MIQIYGCPSGKELACQCRRKRLGFSPWVGKIPWRRAWQLTPVFLPGKSHGQRSLVGYSSWGCERVGRDLATEQKLYIHTHIYAYISICIGVSSSDALFSFCYQSFPASGMRWIDGITDAMDTNLGKLWEMVKHRETCCASVHGIEKSGTRLSD